MKNETKILIVAIIMILSVGPLEYVFSNNSKPIVVPEENNTATSYTFTGNLTGIIIDTQPYINYVGVAAVNSEVQAADILKSIPDIQNYSIDVSLNPNGEGYQYIITVPLNETSDLKETGFRMAVRFSVFFNVQAGPLPYLEGTARIPANFTLLTSSGLVNVTSDENRTEKVFLVYSKKAGETAEFSCQSLVTAVTYQLARMPAYCVDSDLLATTIASRRNLLDYGLGAQDYSLLKVYNQTASLNVAAIGSLEFKGAYHFANISSVSIGDLEGQTNSTMTLYPVNYSDYAGISNGNFTITTNSYAPGRKDYIKSLFAANNFTITQERKNAIVELPETVILNNTVYEIYEIPSIYAQIGSDEGIGPHEFEVGFETIFNEVINVRATRLTFF